MNLRAVSDIEKEIEQLTNRLKELKIEHRETAARTTQINCPQCGELPLTSFNLVVARYWDYSQHGSPFQVDSPSYSHLECMCGSTIVLKDLKHEKNYPMYEFDRYDAEYTYEAIDEYILANKDACKTWGYE